MSEPTHIVVVTGASRGIGKAIADEEARRGAVIIANARQREVLEDNANQWRAMGASLVTVVSGDISMPSVYCQLRQIADSTQRGYELPIILYNNAGVWMSDTDLRTERDREYLDRINHRAPAALQRLLAPDVSVLVLSTAAVFDFPMCAEYTTTKRQLELAGVEALVEGGDVRFYYPGNTDTPGTKTIDTKFKMPVGIVGRDCVHFAHGNLRGRMIFPNAETIHDESLPFPRRVHAFNFITTHAPTGTTTLEFYGEKSLAFGPAYKLLPPLG